MRKITLLIALLAISIFTFGQSLKFNASNAEYDYSADFSKAKIYKNTNQTKVTPIWSEDFANGLPTDWTVADATGNSFVWTYSTVGPRGKYTATTWNIPDATKIIASPTSANGFMMLESDFYNTVDGNIAPTVVDMDTYFATSAIDCSSNSSVILSFSEYYRYCCTSTAKLSVFVSTDGTTFTEFDAKQPAIAVNAPSTNGFRKEINISSVAAGQATVYLIFKQQGASHYFWEVDDINLDEANDNDMMLTNNYVHFGADGSGWFNIIPLSQAVAMPIGFGGTVQNFGSATQTNVTLGIKINDGASDVHTGSQTITQSGVNTYATTLKDTFLIDEANIFTPTAKGVYNVMHNLTQTETDQNPANNKDTMTFKVEDLWYARDNGVPTGWMGPQMWAGKGADGDMFGSSFNFFAKDTLAGLSFYCSSTTTFNGPVVIAHLFSYDGSGWVDKLQSEPYDIAETDLGQWVTLPFNEDVDRTVGADAPTTIEQTIAVIEVSSYGDLATQEFRVGEDNKSINFNYSTLWKLAGETDWAYFTNYDRTPMIRLMVKSTTGINNNPVAKSSINVYPNPTNGIVNISNANNATINVYNMLGEVVMTASNVNSLDMSSLSEGNYVVKVQTTKELVTKKVTLVK